MAPAADTVIFVDIDGVLNVGIRDNGNAPLLLNHQNCQIALGCKDTSAFRPAERECIEKVASVAGRSLGSAENGTYMDYACTSSQQCADLLVGRLAEILCEAEGNVSVVLSSNWRKPKYASRVRQLEQEVSKPLGKEFAFDATTEQGNESSAADRLRYVGKYVRSLCPTGRTTPLRVLVLDDFFVTPLDGWSVEGSKICSACDVEDYLRKCAPSADISAKMVHCYHEWATTTGLRVQVGSGLTAEQVRAARKFVAVQQAEQPPQRADAGGKEKRHAEERAEDKENARAAHNAAGA